MLGIPFQCSARKGAALPQVDGVKGEGVAGNPARRHGHAPVDGGGQNEAVVIVGVLADEIHASGGVRRSLGVAVGGLSEGGKDSFVVQLHF